jgi:hypothetical protein
MPVMNKETGAIRIAADALLAASVEVAGKTDLAITAGGIVRDGFYKGYTGKISFADLYRVYPLGESPIDGSPGFPMTRFGVRGVELKVVLEVTASFSYGSPDASNNYLIPAGVCFKYDTKRAAFDPKGDPLDPANGRVTWVAVATDHTNLNSCTEVIFTLKDGFLTPFKYYSLATDYYMALFATSFGLTLHSPDGSTDYTSPNEAIMYRPDKSEYKSYQALAKYVETICGANGGYLPDRYNDAASPGPYRAICLGPLCVK